MTTVKREMGDTEVELTTASETSGTRNVHGMNRKASKEPINRRG